MPKHPIYVHGTSLFCSGCGRSVIDSIAEKQLWCNNQACKFFHEKFEHSEVVVTARPKKESEATDGNHEAE